LRERDPSPPWQNVAVVAWAGLRGVDSLATSLGLPLVIGTGAAFPHRPLVIFVAFGVILATLVLQGLTLPLIIHWLGVRAKGENEQEEATARRATAQAALDRLNAVPPHRAPAPDALARLRARYQDRLACFNAAPDSEAAEVCDDEILLTRHLRLELLGAERQALINLRNRDIIGDETLRRIERELDLEELRLRAGEEPP
jgi:monovalent cation/hydrogen antiporter